MDALLAYSSSDSSGDENGDDDELVPPVKKARQDLDEACKSRELLAVPNDILHMFAEGESRDDDDKDLHMGRSRSFAHVAGNWATYLHVPITCSSGFGQCVQRLCDHLCGKFPPSAEHAEFHVIPACDLHVTVSRTVAIRHHWIEPLMNKLSCGLTNHRCFKYQLSDLEVYCNDTKTRSFFGLEILFGQENLLQLVETIDDEFEQFKLPKYYEDPSFHLSVIWCLGDIRTMFPKKTLLKLQEHWNKLLQEHGISVFTEYFATEVHCKCGNKRFQFPLKS
ncbi:U6 snRNA phosphodiesterase 1-like [Dysidea avara]|uniref:U6 snRNA phosphodiesterase 1-like n=1 Tax=Dysidea avara TaxID=196820 RepID=UPI00332DBAE4